jgi:hypothetical protein
LVHWELKRATPQGRLARPTSTLHEGPVSTAPGLAVADQDHSGEVSRARSSASLGVLALLCLAYAINAADRQLFSTLLPAIRNAFGWDLKWSGLLSTAFTLFGTLAGAFGWGAAALIELTLFPIIGVIAMGMVDPKQLIAVGTKHQAA